MVLENPAYDSLLFLNSDLQLHGRDFVRTLRGSLFAHGDLAILSPAVIQPGEAQSPWRMMHNWYATDVRFVEWVDFQCPLFRRRFIEDVRTFDAELIYGWGQDLLSGMLCREKGYRIGVLDRVAVVHAGSYTVDREAPGYRDRAMAGMVRYFERVDRIDDADRLRRYAAEYDWQH